MTIPLLARKITKRIHPCQVVITGLGETFFTCGKSTHVMLQVECGRRRKSRFYIAVCSDHRKRK